MYTKTSRTFLLRPFHNINYWIGSEILFLGIGVLWFIIWLLHSSLSTSENIITLLFIVGVLCFGIVMNLVNNFSTFYKLVFIDGDRSISPYAILASDIEICNYLLSNKTNSIFGEIPSGACRLESPNFTLWTYNRSLHRLDGPATIGLSTSNLWFIDGESYSEEEFNKTIQEAKSLPLELRLTDPRWWVREMK